MRMGSTAAAAVTVLTMLPAAGSSASSTGICPAYCGQQGGPKLVALRQLGGGRVSAGALLGGAGRYELVLTRIFGGRLVRTGATVIDDRPRLTLTGRFPRGGRRQVVALIQLRSQRGGVRFWTFVLNHRSRLAAGEYVATVNALSRSGGVRLRGSSIAVSVSRKGRIGYLLEPHLAPDASTGPAGSVAQTTASVSGSVDPYGQPTTYYFQYGTTGAYGAQTGAQSAGTGRRTTSVSSRLLGLSFGTTYHYRLVASSCSGCRWGTSYGVDHTFTTLAATGLSQQQIDADRAVAAYNSMKQYLYAGDGSSLYSESSPQTGNRYSYLWPFSRALAGTITLAGVPPALLGGANYGPDVSDRLVGLSRFWDGKGYDSYPVAPYGKGGDKYYDDQAWVGLASAQDYRLAGDPAALADAQHVFGFVYPGGWAGSASFDPGGIYWVNQGVGVGVSNHNRTTTSTVPNAEVALLLEGLDPANAAAYDAGASQMYGWANHYLYNVNTNPTDPSAPNPNFDPGQPALMFDKVRGTGTVDKTLWTYNQGTMIAADVREYQRTGLAAYLSDAEAIANTALDTFSESSYIAQPAAFNAIFFRGLLVLYSATGDGALRSRIIQTIQAYADDAWNNYRSNGDLFRFPSSPGTGHQLLDQGAMVQIYAALAWSPSDYDKLP